MTNITYVFAGNRKNKIIIITRGLKNFFMDLTYLKVMNTTLV